MESAQFQLRRGSEPTPVKTLDFFDERCLSSPDVFSLHAEPVYHDLTEDWSDEKQAAQEGVRSWLEELGLVQYFKEFVKEGLDDMRIIEKLSPADVDEMATLCKMPRFHRKHLLRGIEVQNRQSSSESTDLFAALACVPTPSRFRISTWNEDEIREYVMEKGHEVTQAESNDGGDSESCSGSCASACSCASLEAGQLTASTSDEYDDKVDSENDEDAMDDMSCQEEGIKCVCSSADGKSTFIQLVNSSDDGKAAASRNRFPDARRRFPMPYDTEEDDLEPVQEEITLEMLKHWGQVKVF